MLHRSFNKSCLLMVNNVVRGWFVRLHFSLPSSGDTELAFMAARLAVGKSGDGFSISDSALGTRSLVSFTTAGVTQFSEVSQISICCRLS